MESIDYHKLRVWDEYLGLNWSFYSQEIIDFIKELNISIDKVVFFFKAASTNNLSFTLSRHGKKGGLLYYYY